MPTTTTPIKVEFEDDGTQQHPVESNELISNCLVLMKEELASLADNKKKYAELAEKKCPSLASDAFKLMFLRTEVFAPKEAAERYARYWENRVSLRGLDNAFEPLPKKSDQNLPKDLQEAIALDYMRTIPGHDRVVYAKAGNLKGDYGIDSVIVACWMVLHEALNESEEMQKKGAVFVVDVNNSKFDQKFVKRCAETIGDGFPLRTSKICFTNPPKIMGVFIKFFKLFLKAKVRKRVHVIDHEEKLLKHTGLSAAALIESH